MSKMQLAAADMGNAIYNTIINGRTYKIPNAIARCFEENVSYYNENELTLFDNMIVEIDSGSLTRSKRQKHYVGVSATKQDGISDVDRNNRKADKDRTMIMLLTTLAYDVVMNNDGEKIDYTFDIAAVALPTKQVKSDRTILVEKIKGFHTITFKHVPNRGDVTVNLRIVDAVCGTEGATSFMALSRDSETLKIKNEALMTSDVLIADLGGGSLDPVGLSNGKIIEGIEGQVFGINSYIDDMRTKIENEIGYTFNSRYDIEEILAKGQSNWNVTHRQKKVDITQYVEPYLRAMSVKFLSLLEKTMRNILLQQVSLIYPIGGAVKVAKKYIIEENDNSENPMELTFVDDLDTLNSQGLWILVNMYANKLEKEKVTQEVAVTKEETPANNNKKK